MQTMLESFHKILDNVHKTVQSLGLQHQYVMLHSGKKKKLKDHTNKILSPYQ